MRNPLAWPLVGLLVVTACNGNTGDPTSLDMALDMAVAGNPDQSATADLSSLADFSYLPDLSALPDLSIPVDQQMPDLQMPDLTILPDLTSLPDLVPLPDLVVSNYPINGFSASAFDVSNDGSAIAVGVQGAQIMAQCFKGDGSVQKAAFSAATWDNVNFNNLQLSVVRAGTTHQSAITWHVFNVGWPNPYDWRNYVVFLDDSCNVIAPAATLDPGESGIVRAAELAAGNQGIFAFFYEFQSGNTKRLLLFGPTGTLLLAQDVGANACGIGGLSEDISINRTTGDILLGCEATFDRYYRRYTAAGAAIDAAWVLVPQANVGAWHDFEVGINDQGAFVFLDKMQNNAWLASFYTAAGALTAMQQFGMSGSSGNRILAASNGDFIFDVAGNGYQRIRFAPDGTQVSTSPSGGLIRIDGSNIVYLLQNNGIAKNPFPL